MAMGVPALGARAADTALQLEVTLNGFPTAKIGEFIQRDGELFARPAELAELGIRVPAVAAPDGLMALSAIAGLGWQLDPAAQTLALTAGAGLLIPSVLRGTARPEPHAPIESGTGATLNYDLVGNSAAGRVWGNGFFDLRGFSPFGVASTSLLAYAGSGPSGKNDAIRLDSGFAYADPLALRRYRVGDFISGGLNWTRPVRLGGLQVQSDFSMRPDLVTFPLPTASGAVTVPSTVDVIVNSSRMLSRQIAPGPFEVSQVPVVTGAGAITTTVTNLLGEQVTTSMPFYASADLLAPGLQSYSADLGWVRQNWGLRSNDYDRPAAALTYRRGLSSLLTGEFHAQGMAGLAMAGAGVAANVFNFMTVNAAVAGSIAGRTSGGLLSVGAQRLGRTFSFGVNANFSDRNFRDIAAQSGAPAPRRQISANASLALGRSGSFGVAYTGIARDPGGDGFLSGSLTRNSSSVRGLEFVSLVPEQRADILSASYSVQLGAISIYATGFRDLANKAATGALLGVTLPLGTRSSVSASMGSADGGVYGQLQAVQSPVEIGDFGYQANAISSSRHAFLEGQYKASFGLLSAGIDQLHGLTTLRGQMGGALSVVAGEGLFASNKINDSFAVVSTGEVPGVAVMEENRLVGRTGPDGRILVPDLRAFDVNRLSIDPNDIPITDTVDHAARVVRPQDRSGVVVRFPIRRGRSARIRLTDALGELLPMGGTATLAATGVTVPTGHDGEVYVEDLQSRDNRLDVVQPDGRRCSVTFDYDFRPGAIPMIGPILCAET